jgi:predicted Fe-Mo cluster-binding NifX family protein
MSVHRIAVATDDGINVFQHFGMAQDFRILDIDETSRHFVEERKAPPRENHTCHDLGHFDRVLALLSDCEAIVVGQIGEGAAEYILRSNMRIFQAPGEVEKALDTIIQRQMLEDTSPN